MIRLALLAVILLVLVTAVVLVTRGGPHDAPTDRHLSEAATTTLVVLGMLAIGVAITLGFTVGDGWPLLPIGAWAGAYLAVRAHDRNRPQRERAKLEQRRDAARRRLDEFGADGAAMLDEAEAAIARINGTRAATQGWLGQPDFTADVEMIADSLRKITALRSASDEWAALPNPTDEDRAQITDAQRTIGEIKAAVANRLQILQDCADQAEEVDRALEQQHGQHVLAQRRDDLRGRLSALLTGASMTPPPEPSEATDLVRSRVAAFHELEATIERHRRPGPATP
ncbi:hypothetical protein [Mycolicibacterium thermoresistibile]